MEPKETPLMVPSRSFPANQGLLRAPLGLRRGLHRADYGAPAGAGAWSWELMRRRPVAPLESHSAGRKSRPRVKDPNEARPTALTQFSLL